MQDIHNDKTSSNEEETSAFQQEEDN